MVFFSPTDCGSCLEDKSVWEKIHKIGKINVVGIARHSDKNELKKWIKHSELTFRILYDENGQLTTHIIDYLKDFHISYTPAKVLVNQKGEMILIDLPRSTLQEQEEFLNLLKPYQDSR